MAQLMFSTEFNSVDELRDSKNRNYPDFLYACMTAGKTTLEDTLRKPIIDTDVIWDWTMDGWDVIREARRNPKSAKIGYPAVELMAQALHAMTDFPLVTQMDAFITNKLGQFKTAWCITRDVDDALNEFKIRTKAKKGRALTSDEKAMMREHIGKIDKLIEKEVNADIHFFSTIIKLDKGEHLCDLFGVKPDFRQRSGDYSYLCFGHVVLPHLIKLMGENGWKLPVSAHFPPKRRG